MFSQVPDGMLVQGQASPREVPAIVVRVAGQIGERPSMSTDQRVGSGTIGMLEPVVWVEG